MSRNIMLVCKEDKSYYDGTHPELAIFIDESGMREPFTEFGKWFCNLYCGEPSMMEQMRGYNEIDWLELTKVDVVGIEEAIDTYVVHEKMKVGRLLDYLWDHIGKLVLTEFW